MIILYWEEKEIFDYKVEDDINLYFKLLKDLL